MFSDGWSSIIFSVAYFLPWQNVFLTECLVYLRIQSITWNIEIFCSKANLIFLFLNYNYLLLRPKPSPSMLHFLKTGKNLQVLSICNLLADLFIICTCNIFNSDTRNILLSVGFESAWCLCVVLILNWCLWWSLPGCLRWQFLVVNMATSGVFS